MTLRVPATRSGPAAKSCRKSTLAESPRSGLSAELGKRILDSMLGVAAAGVMPGQRQALDQSDGANKRQAEHRQNGDRRKNPRRIERALRAQNDVTKSALRGNEFADNRAHKGE